MSNTFDENEGALMQLNEDMLLQVERIFYGITRTLIEGKQSNPYPQKEEILRALEDYITSSPTYDYLRLIFDEIISARFYTRLMRNKSLIYKITTFCSLTDGLGRLKNRVIPAGYLVQPRKESLVYSLYISLSIFSLVQAIFDPNPIYLNLSARYLIFPGVAATSYLALNRLVNRRLNFKDYCFVTVRIKNEDREIKINKMINSVTPTRIFKKRILRKRSIRVDDADEIVIIAKGNLHDEFVRIPLKDSMPLNYLMLLGGKTDEIVVQKISFSHIRKRMLRKYPRYLERVENDYLDTYYKRLFNIPFMIYDEEKLGKDLPANWSEKIPFSFTHKDYENLRQQIARAIIYYTLLDSEGYDLALFDYAMLRKIANMSESDEDQGDPFLSLITTRASELPRILEKHYSDTRIPPSNLLEAVNAARAFLNHMDSIVSTSERTKKLILNNIINENFLIKFQHLRNIIDCFCIGKPIPYMERDVMRFANRFFYGVNIIDNDWLDHLVNNKVEEREVYRKLQKIIATKGNKNILQYRQSSIRLNELIHHIAHRYCIKNPRCKICHARTFCRFARGEVTKTLNDLLTFKERRQGS